MNNPLKLIDPTGMIVEWHDSKCELEKGETQCRTRKQRAYEKALEDRLNSKDNEVRAGAALVMDTYRRLQASTAVFEVLKSTTGGENAGELTFSGNNHFEVHLYGNDPFGLTDNQRLAHEFEHGRQVLDRELSFYPAGAGFVGFMHDLTDEALGFGASFELEPASPGQGRRINDVQAAYNRQGLNGVIDQIRTFGNYSALDKGPFNVPPTAAPRVYRPPQ